MSGSRTFSDHWHRVANLRLALRPTLKIQRQVFRGELWYVARDPLNDSYFRLQPAAYAFASRLTPSRTVESVWEECLEVDPEHALGQEDVIAVLTQLHGANLLYSREATDTARVFERLERRRKEKLRSRLMNFLYPHIPLVDPDRALGLLMPVWRLLASPLGWALWIAVVAAGVKAVIEHAGELMLQGEGVLAPNNWWALFLGMVVIKTAHELGHAASCKYLGGEVHTLGVSLMVFTPMPYVDATSAWGFRSRWHRALVGAGGMIAEFFVAALAALAWANTGAGLFHSVCYNMMWVASVTSVFFNLNPLVRFDGYYILSDLLDIPNLSARANQQVFHVFEKWLLGNRASVGAADGRLESALLFVYGVLGGLYRAAMSVSIVLYIGGKFFALGALIAVSCLLTWAVLPAWRMAQHVLTSPSLARTRLRAIAVCVLIAGGGALLLAAVPVPRRFRAPGVLEAVHLTQINTNAAGAVVRFEPSGTRVTKGAPVATLANPELELDLAMARSQLEEIDAIEAKAQVRSIADLEPLRQRRRAILSLIDNLKDQQASLVVRARQDGTWVVPRGNALARSWLRRGDNLGLVVDPTDLRFTAVVSQDDASELFAGPIGRVELRLFAQEESELEVASYRIIPFQQRDLPSAALGWRGGGDIATSQSDTTGTKSAESFFEIEATLKPSKGVTLLHGRSGQLRLSLTPEPLLYQLGRKLRQLVQKRYRV